MEFFVKDVRIKQGFFTKKTYLYFKFLASNGWRRAKTEFSAPIQEASIGIAATLMGNCIKEALWSKKTRWSENVSRTNNYVTTYFASQELTQKYAKIKI